MVSFCFDKTELKRLWAEVDVRNVASSKCYGANKSGL